MIARPKDLYTGLVFVASGVVLFIAAQQYEVGTANHMGAGYLPALAGLALVFLGGCSLLTAARNRTPDPIERNSLEPLVLVVASVVAFALLIDSAGFIVAMFGMIFLSCLRRVRTNPLEVFALYAILTAFCVVVFKYALDMPLPLGW